MRVAAVGSSFGLERRLFNSDGKAEAANHLIEHVIVLVANPADADLQCDVSVSQVIARATQRERLRGSHCRDRFGLGDDLHDTTIVREQQISAPQDLSSLEDQSHFFTGVQRGAQAALAPQLERQDEFHVSGLGGGGQSAGDIQHEVQLQKRKYRCASGSTVAGSQVSNWPSARTSYVCESTSILGW